MATSQTDVIQIVEARAELRANERVGRRVKLTSDTVGLEAIDASSDIVDVVSPSGDDGVALDTVARDAGRCETTLETYLKIRRVIIRRIRNEIFANTNM